MTFFGTQGLEIIYLLWTLCNLCSSFAMNLIMHFLGLQEYSFQGANMKVAKYLDSFPFPYYIVLRNIEALPRTLADLMRQVSLYSYKQLQCISCAILL